MEPTDLGTRLMTDLLRVAPLIAVVALHVFGVRHLKRRYSSRGTPPANASLLKGHLGYLGSGFLSMGSSAAGLYALDLFFPQGLLIPWSKLGRPHRLGPLTWYWMREVHLPIVVRTSLISEHQPQARVEA